MISPIHSLLSGLTSNQSEAILHRGSPLLIIAGPGSGKTEVLSRRVAHLILTGDANPENMLITTFTNKAALELKDRIQRKLPDLNVELMHISTIHSFCADLLRSYGQSLDLSGDFRILDNQDQFLFIYTHRKDLGLDAIIKGRPHQFFSSVVHAFNIATEELVDPTKLEAWCCQNSACCCEDEAELWNERSVVSKAYGHYLNLLTNESLVDFAQLQKTTLNLMEDKNILKEIQDLYSEFLIDEYQDTDIAQDTILLKLAGNSKHITVVGDDDQSIYRFRGATVRNITTFCKRFPGTKTIKLEDNFRSKLPIVKSSQNVIIHNPARISKDLKSIRGPGSDILLTYRHTAGEEAWAIADLLRRLHQAGKITRYGDVALLLRSVRSYSGPYLIAFHNAGIPFFITGDGSFFERPEIAQMYDLLNFLQASKPWGDIHIRNDLTGLSHKTKEALKEYKEDLLEIASEDGLKRIGISEETDLKKVLNLLELKTRIKDKKHDSLLDIFFSLLAAIGCISYFEKAGDVEALLNLGAMSKIFAMWDEFGNTRNLYPFMQYLKLLKEGGMDPVTVSSEDAVQIMTIHQAKGLEFPVVVVGSAMNGRLPASKHQSPYEIPVELRASGEPEVNDPHLVDERKLFYVAATRARDLLIVGTADVVNKRGKGPSQFVEEMSSKDLQIALDWTKAYIEEVESHGKHGAGPRPRHSFSQLAYFLQCPVRYKLAVIYGFQVPWQDPVGYGSNVHRALEAIHKQAIKGRIPTEDEISSIVTQVWVSSGHTKPELEKKFISAAINHLKRYIMEHGDSLSSVIKAETSFSYDLLDQVMLGKIDLLREKEGLVEVIDFKTSKKKPIKEEGIDLQLDLYALGAEKSLGYRVDTTTVHFLNDGQFMQFPWSQKRKEKALDMLKSILDSIAKQEFPPNRSYCSRCQEFRNICPYYSCPNGVENSP